MLLALVAMARCRRAALSPPAMLKLLSGKTVGVDSTTLEADAAMKSIIRRDRGADWQAYVTRLMREDGAIAPNEDPTDEDVRRFDRSRKDKKVSNDMWVSPTDPDAPGQLAGLMFGNAFKRR